MTETQTTIQPVRRAIVNRVILRLEVVEQPRRHRQQMAQFNQDQLNTIIDVVQGRVSSAANLIDKKKWQAILDSPRRPVFPGAPATL